MAQVGIRAVAELTSFGASTGSIWATVPPSTIQHYTSPTTLSVGAAQQVRTDFVPTAGIFSANVAFSATLSAGGDNFVVATGSTAKATYISNTGQVFNDTWTRTS